MDSTGEGDIVLLNGWQACVVLNVCVWCKRVCHFAKYLIFIKLHVKSKEPLCGIVKATVYIIISIKQKTYLLYEY